MDLVLSDEVAKAISDRQPVVALESTVIAHGLPHPENINTALECEAAVRAGGAVPATIAVFGGKFCIGLDRKQIESLATTKDIRKISRRDLPIAVGLRLDCATTVATTAYIAHRAGIAVFATGGIGGVHRGFEADVSADLPELSRTPITVVSSGAKIVLDLERTREWLETHGVTVLGWRCSELPAFYSHDSGLAVDETVHEADGVAAIVRARDELGLSSAILVAVPVPHDFEIPRALLEPILDEAIAAAAASGIVGKAVTPYLLARLSERTGGRTLATNIALLKNNAAVAAEIAVALASS